MIRIRKDRGLTQEQLADAIGVRKLQIFRYENGQAGVDLALVDRIAEVLQVSVEELLFQAPTPEQTEIIAWVLKADPENAKTLRNFIVPFMEKAIKLQK
jgi:transcriptional regulator with XRE-family HTH domain